MKEFRSIKDRVKWLADRGLDPEYVRTGKSVIYRITTKSGDRAMVAMPISPSCYRSSENWVSYVNKVVGK